MAEGQGYIGSSPGDSSVIIADQTFEPTGIQTNFTFASGYDPGYIDVYLNGARLIYANDYTATDGSTVALVDAAANGDVLECVAYKAFNVATVDSSTGNFTVGQDLTVTGDTTATDINAVGIVTATGGLEVGVAGVGGTIAANGNTTLAGVVTATSFVGDGSGLTGVASTDNIITGVAVTIGGILRVTDTTESTSSITGAVIVSGGVGIAKSLHVGGNVSVGGTLTYEDVTNQDVLGLSTFRNGVQFGVAGVGGTIDGVGNAIISGITTVGTGLTLADNVRAKFGNDGDLAIYHNASNSFIVDNGTGPLYIRGNDAVRIESYVNDAAGEPMIVGNSDGSVDLYFNNSQKFETHNTGVRVTGVSTVTGNSFVGSAISMYASSGIVSATAFYGDGSQLEGVSASGGGDIDITSCLFI